MNKKHQKIVIFFLLLFFLFISINFIYAQNKERKLEIKYPEIFGGLPNFVEKTLLPVYVKYIFNFIIAIAGITALGVLTYSGIFYLISAGDPEKLEKSKKQIISAFAGIILILASWLILYTINPKLVTLQFEGAIELPISAPSLNPPPAPPFYPNFLWRITEIADSIKQISENGINKISQDILLLASMCDCKFSQPLCLNQDPSSSDNDILLKYKGGECRAIYCYSSNENQPCPNGQIIKDDQQSLVASLSEMLYYKKRANEEKNDFPKEIGNLNKEISYKEKEIKAEKEYLNKIASEVGKKQQEELIKKREEEKEKLINKQKLYTELEKELNNLDILIERIISPTNKLSELPNECLSNIKTKCGGICQGGGHDTTGCFPSECKGKKEGENNPCPIEIIKEKFDEITPLVEIINATSNNIINLIKIIIKL